MKQVAIVIVHVRHECQVRNEPSTSWKCVRSHQRIVVHRPVGSVVAFEAKDLVAQLFGGEQEVLGLAGDLSVVERAHEPGVAIHCRVGEAEVLQGGEGWRRLCRLLMPMRDCGTP